MEPKEAVVNLVDRFQRNRDTYRSQGYNETQVRQEFINPFFEALGWDVANRAGYAEPYKDVIHEDAIKVGGATKAPDYCFRIGGTRKFFLEAKKPSVDVKGDIAPAYQLRRYGWSAKLPLSILTDFEEFAVYDCRQRPKPTDGAATGRILYLTYGDYLDRFSEIYDVFARESVLRGSFDKFAESATGKRGTQEVDAAFLAEIEGWREALAKNLALRNPSLSVRDLNFAVQVTIDRIIFLRMCEDRGIEPYAQLQALLNGGRVYPRLVDILHQADDRYNSGLFDFRADALTPSLAIDDKVLKDLFSRLYYPESPYEFSVLGADILGNVYEQFLGKVIRLTAGHQAKVEEKPEVKKAGGVYYTPTYICDYIVKQTVGKLVEGKTPKQVSKLRILDPACGSGSFLLAAYQYLLDWHRDWYVAHGPEKHTEEIYVVGRGIPPRQRANDQKPSEDGTRAERDFSPYDYRLTTREKKRILLNNLYGVDIDSQAVEVTKLSLLLKVLEGENKDTLESQLSLWRERALPDLGNNIKCGNSLIGPDFYQQQTLALDEEEMNRINAFDWEREFPEVMKAGGFDAVIGNPPYIRIQTMKEWAPREVEFYKQRYRSASKGNYDIYVVFVERGLQLLNAKGRLGFILPHKFFNAKYGEALRKIVSDGKHIAEVVHFGDQQVFAGATTYTCLMFLDKGGVPKCRFVKAHDLSAWRNNEAVEEGDVPAAKVAAAEWNFAIGRGASLFERLSEMPVKLGDVAKLFVGLQTDADDVFILEQVSERGDIVVCHSNATGADHEFESAHLKRLLKGSLNIRRYSLSGVNKRLIFPYETRGTKSVLLGIKEYQARFPRTWEYLESNRKRLSSRNKGRLPTDEWHGYVYRKNHTLFECPKLLVPSIATGACFAADLSGDYFFVGSGGGGGGGYGITISEDTAFVPLYLLGVLNSSVSDAFLKSISTPFRGGYLALNRQYIQQLPIRPIDFSSPADVAKHDRMVELVERMLDLHKRLPAAQTPHDKELLQRQINATDQQIDRLVYELYELTEEEIGIVEVRQ